MMREGWTYKKLGEICEIERGGSPRPIQKYITDDEDGLNWIKIGDAVEGSKYINSTKEKIIKDGLKKSRFVHKGDFILSNSMSFGKPYILGIDGCIHDGWLLIRDIDNLFDKSFLYYFLGSPQMYNEFKRMAVGGVVNNLNSQMVRNISIPVPPLSEQERIVSELDLLSAIIEKKKAQLKEYEKLAQSIFYDMFGDPVTNEKGWEVKKLGEVCEITSSLIDPQTFPYSEMLHVSPSNIISGTGEIIDCLLAKEEVLISNKYTFTKDMVLYSKIRPNLNKVATPSFDGICSADMYPLTIKSFANKVFIRHVLLGKHFLSYAIKHSGRARMPKINREALFAYIFPLPPLPLQQSFASKIEAIERQKALIQQSITETETLFNSRMDYYFD